MKPAATTDLSMLVREATLDLGHDLVLLARVPLGLAAMFRRPDFLEAYLEVARV